MFGPFQQTFRLSPPAQGTQDLVGLQIVFHPTRSRVLESSLTGFAPALGVESTSSSSYGAPHVFQATWTPPLGLDPSGFLELKLSADEVPLVPYKVIWRGKIPPDAPPLRIENTRSEWWSTQLSFIWNQGVRQDLLNMGKRQPDGLTNFFDDLDGKTLGGHGSPPTKDMKEEVSRTRQALCDRLAARMHGLPHPVPGNLPRYRLDLADLSQLQCTAYRKAWKELKVNAGQPIPCAAIHKVAEDFCQFASGVNSKDHSVFGQPDSGYYFLFAEFALAALEPLPGTTDQYAVSDKADRDLWAALLPALVHSQQTFIATYQPAPRAQPGKRPWASWRFDNRPVDTLEEEAQGWQSRGMRRVTDPYGKSPNFATEAAENAKAAFSDDPVAPSDFLPESLNVVMM